MKKLFLIFATISTLSAIFFSYISLSKLGGTGDGDPILIHLGIIDRAVKMLGFALLFVIVYLFLRKWKEK